MTTKEAIRAAHIERRRALSDSERQSAARDMGVLFAGFTFFKRRSCCAFLSHDNEIPTRYLIRQILAWNASCAVPAWDTETKSYQFYAFHAQTRLVKGRYGIREPEHRVLVSCADARMLLVPGVAFDAAGNRIGHGKGYYDAILAKTAPNALKVGVCYDWQIIPGLLPVEPRDIPVDFLLTNRRVHCCAPAKLRASP